MESTEASYIQSCANNSGLPPSRSPFSSRSSHHASSSDPFSPASPAAANATHYAVSPSHERRSLDMNANYSNTQNQVQGGDIVKVIIRRLSTSTDQNSLNNMFMLAEDFVDAKLLEHAWQGEEDFHCAVVHFRSFAGAEDVCKKLNHKPNADSTVTMMAYVQQIGSSAAYDANVARKLSSASSASSPNDHGGRHSYRFNGTFQPLDRVSPTRSFKEASPPLNETGDTPFGSYPYGPHLAAHRVTGKNVIDGEAVDDDTGKLLKDPIAYAERSQMTVGGFRPHPPPLELPVREMGGLKLSKWSSSDEGPPLSPLQNTYNPSRARYGLYSPVSDRPPTGSGGNMPAPMSPTYPMGMDGTFAEQHRDSRFFEPPPVNPADQNPPCNTLYVGNLPVDTSEDELKALFSKERGYRRLCFRTKHNGPMCFVEFEDVGHASIALHHLYGFKLRNSVKGGIRLSFSKNPLGVRSGQGVVYGPHSPLASPTSATFNITGPQFSTAHGPPPGLAAPAGWSPPMTSAGSPNIGTFFPPISPTATSPSLRRGSFGAYQHGAISASMHNPFSPTFPNPTGR